VGVVHLPPLPGTPRGGTVADLEEILDRVRRDALAYAEGGADAIIVENFGDVPFRKVVQPETIAVMTRAVLEAKAASGLPMGVNVLRNDVLGAVSVAAMTGAAFVRANVYVGAMVTDQGVIEGNAAEVQALIRRLGAPVDVWADVDVKHASPIAPRSIADEARDAVERGLAGTVIVSGRGTGQPVAEADLQAVQDALPEVPIYVGSGATAESIPILMRWASGVIVGTAAKADGVVENPVAVERVRALAEAVQQATR
jgi:membrane complex biogenesis BtpA family protein